MMSALTFTPRGAELIEAQEDPMRGMCAHEPAHLKVVLWGGLKFSRGGAEAQRGRKWSRREI